MVLGFLIRRNAVLIDVKLFKYIGCVVGCEKLEPSNQLYFFLELLRSC